MAGSRFQRLSFVATSCSPVPGSVTPTMQHSRHRSWVPLIPTAFLLAWGSAAASGAQSPGPVPVRATPLAEVDPVWGAGYLAWSQNSRRHPQRFAVFARSGSRAPFRVSSASVQGRPSSIFHGILAYQEWTADQSDIRFFD